MKSREHHRISDYLKDLKRGGDHILLFAHELVMGNDTLLKWMKKIGKAKPNVRNGVKINISGNRVK